MVNTKICGVFVDGVVVVCSVDVVGEVWGGCVAFGGKLTGGRGGCLGS